MEAGLHVNLYSEQSYEYDGRYEKEAIIHVIIGVLSSIPVVFLLRTARNNLEISRKRPFLALILFTFLCAIIRTGLHIFYLLSTGSIISINICTIFAHTYYVAEVLPQQLSMIILLYALLDNHLNMHFDYRNEFKCAGIVTVIAIGLNTIQFFIGTPSPNFPLCMPYNINFELNDIYHHLGFCILFANIGISLFLYFRHTDNLDAATPREVQKAIYFTLLSYSSCCLMVILPVAYYTHIHEFPVWMLAIGVNAFEYFHSFAAGFLASVFIFKLPYLRASIIDSIGFRNRFILQLLE